jgi:sodium-independent sulfate anion transporter 11
VSFRARDMSEESYAAVTTPSAVPYDEYGGRPVGGAGASGIPVVPTYHEPVISVKDFGRKVIANPKQRAIDYGLSLFPIARWIYRYNFTWLISDLIAGITVGAVVVPQGMSYAKLATLPAQYGLYSSFVGVFIYCFFATSKDVSIGPVAVMSLQVSKSIAHVVAKNPQYKNDNVEIAVTLTTLCGIIAFGIGILRLGFLLEYISMPAVLGFMTGSAFTILVGQIPALMGISNLFNTRDATHLVVINTLKNLKYSNLNAAFGVVSLFVLYFARWFFDFMGKRYPKYKRVCFFGGVLRNAFVIVVATLISWGICKGKNPKNYPISILLTVPRGLQDVGYHPLNTELASAVASELPVSTIVLLLEHIAISKSFGRLNDYKINPNQEVVAIGVTNLIGTFFNAYPATGSFSRSALKSKCGVRTPLAGIYTGVVVLIAIYALTGTFYYIPNATLSAIIIHAVSDLMSPITVTWKFWKASPVDLLIFLGAVFLSVFVSLEAGIYMSIAASAFYMLLRISFPTGQFLGRVEFFQVENPHIREQLPEEVESDVKKSQSRDCTDKKSYYQVVTSPNPTPRVVRKYKWVSLNHNNINQDVQVAPPPRGVFVFRPGESFTYPNSSRQIDILVDHIRANTRKGGDQRQIVKLGDRPWNDHGPRHRKIDTNFVDPRPVLRAVVFDFSATPVVDLTGVQALVDARQQLNKYANREVEYHFVSILSPWVRRALMAESFGGDLDHLRPERHYVEVAFREGAALDTPDDQSDKRKGKYKDEEERDTVSATSEDGSYVPLVGTNTPFFHLDVPDLEFAE